MNNNPAVGDTPPTSDPIVTGVPLPGDSPTPDGASTRDDMPAPDDAPMPDSVKYACADLMFTDAVETLARRLGISTTESRSRLIESGAYAAMYDLETGLWREGPDYFIGFYEGMPGVRRKN